MEEPRTGDERSLDPVETLLSGLQDQADAMDAVYDDSAAEDLARAERAEVPLLDRLRAANAVVIEVAGHGPIEGVVAEVGRDVVVIDASDGTWAIVLGGISAVTGLAEVAERATAVSGRLGLACVARSWSRERAVVRIHRWASAPLDGTIDRVGADHVDLAEHDPGVPRRGEQVRRSVVVPLAAISALRRRA
ncbi:MAG: hypothetical protein FJW80_07575 [Actinobacteria bacterium]|nr:hypothetical protein [Actinomycetota bacterium]